MDARFARVPHAHPLPLKTLQGTGAMGRPSMSPLLIYAIVVKDIIYYTNGHI